MGQYVSSGLTLDTAETGHEGKRPTIAPFYDFEKGSLRSTIYEWYAGCPCPTCISTQLAMVDSHGYCGTFDGTDRPRPRSSDGLARRAGAWRVEFGGEAHFPMTGAASAIGRLGFVLANPNTPLSVSQLYWCDLTGTLPADEEVIDSTALNDVRQKRNEIAALLDQPSLGDSRRNLESQLAQLERYLARVTRIDGKPRRDGRHEQARKNVFKSLREAIATLRPRLPFLAVHLDLCLELTTKHRAPLYGRELAVRPKGGPIVYRPPDNIRWVFVAELPWLPRP